jgi:hypothetical protein
MHLVRHGAALIAEAPVQQGAGDPARAFGRSIRTDSSAITDSFAEAPDRLSSRIDAGPLTVIDSPTLIVIDRVFSAI